MRLLKASASSIECVVRTTVLCTGLGGEEVSCKAACDVW